MSEVEAKKAIDAFFAGFNAQDNEAIRKSLHFPHVRFASGRVRIAPESSEFKTPFNFLIEHEGWHHSSLDSVEVIHASDDKVHFAIEFSRYKADGSKYATHQSLWIVTKEGGHWGIIARSSFAP
ncbi:MAG: hypothetical protein JRG97_14825 [Deltaproteobacteria bacterium]|nr:hypothetical protein [Deltaproteobacteria bacterium]MBW2052493.1 hypothetical protein [Deltaproteobacteria bacterium]MBW2142315.1 hypothetical protein [Deltaproteobacteria bacterium]MBW2324414.1 hypothetical protein [Deltaproteobacteria bacterium]